MDFEAEWSLVEGQVRRICQRRLRDDDFAEEILQRVRIRAWRGYSSFERRSSFSTWVISIAQREIIRRDAAKARSVAVEDFDEFEAPEVESGPLPNLLEAFARALDDAVDIGDLSATEAGVVRAFLADPESSWTEIGPSVGLTAGHCAVIYFRAIRKLRVTLLCRHQALLGGRAPVQRAHQAALTADPERRLTSEESDVFRRCIFEGNTPPARRREELREACRKVALQLNRG